jgi:hypothetical protein
MQLFAVDPALHEDSESIFPHASSSTMYTACFDHGGIVIESPSHKHSQQPADGSVQ